MIQLIWTLSLTRSLIHSLTGPLDQHRVVASTTSSDHWQCSTDAWHSAAHLSPVGASRYASFQRRFNLLRPARKSDVGFRDLVTLNFDVFTSYMVYAFHREYFYKN